MGHEVINLLGGGDAVFDEPQRFAPHRLQQPIPDMSRDFSSKGNRLHTDIS